MKPSLPQRLGIWTSTLALLAPTFAQAASVDLATAPMVSGLNKVVKPNILFILDDSGSMDWEYMPDGQSSNFSNKKPCALNWGANSIYYNPNITYLLPLKGDGTSYAAATATAAKDDGFATSTSTVNLTGVTTTTTNNSTQDTTVNLGSNPFRFTNNSDIVIVTSPNHGLTTGTTVTFNDISTKYFDQRVRGDEQITVIDANTFSIRVGGDADGSGTAGGSNRSYTVTRTTTTTVTTPNYFYYDYTASPASPPTTCASDASYTKVGVNSLTTAQQQNFANWYQYYRKRIYMMKSAASRTFSALDSNYRLGFSKISETGTATSGFLPIKTFDSTQKNSWYTMLLASQPNSYTPLRGALSKAGRYYAGKLVTGNNDPVQYSCQQNFTILTTDGYWNTNVESSSYGPLKMDNVTQVGNQDGTLSTPFKDTYSNSLADVAMYYYQTDLRTGTGTAALGGLLDDGSGRLDVTSNNVPGSTSDTNTAQHMVSFTIGLGVSGLVQYDADYYINGGTLPCPTGSTTCMTYKQILQGTKNWPDPITNTDDERIDDLWHAAVNGHGRYLSAKDPNALIASLQATLSTISAMKASSAATSTSNLQPVSGDNSAFVAQYTTSNWVGDLQQRSIDLVTGAVSATAGWSAAAGVDASVSGSSDTRTIYTFSSSASNKLKTFTAANLVSEIAAGYFKSSGSNPGGALSQWSTLNSSQQSLATDAAMIGFLRGQTGNENTTNNTLGFFRDRTSSLGDIVDSAPVYVSKPNFKYVDSGYSTFKSTNSSRTPMVYTGGNDGMLHAFNASTGAELWTYIPTPVIPNLYKLADASYPTSHQFLVDGPITVGDVWDGTNWKTILVGGLGGGGRSFYALDVTDPTAPKALWEFSQSGGTVNDTDLGYSYGNPVITKRASDSKWVVLLTSGYNNSAGDGKGRLYVLDASDGSKLSEIITDGTTDPNVSGLTKVAGYVTDSNLDNRTQYVYGGDLGGRLWRFDISNASVQKLGQTNSTLGAQPITVRPELASVKDASGTAYRVVYFGTGRYLGLSDLSTTSPSNTIAQTVFGVKDTGTDVGVFRDTSAALVAQTLNSSVTPRTVANPISVNWQTKNGWFVDLPVGERINIDPRLQLGSLVVLSNAPKDDYCSVGGSSYLYTFDYASGGAVLGQAGKYVGWPVGNSIATGLTLIQVTTGNLTAVLNLSDSSVTSLQPPNQPTAGGTLRRVGYREIR